MGHLPVDNEDGGVYSTISYANCPSPQKPEIRMSRC